MTTREVEVMGGNNLIPVHVNTFETPPGSIIHCLFFFEVCLALWLSLNQPRSATIGNRQGIRHRHNPCASRSSLRRNKFEPPFPFPSGGKPGRAGPPTQEGFQTAPLKSPLRIALWVATRLSGAPSGCGLLILIHTARSVPEAAALVCEQTVADGNYKRRPGLPCAVRSPLMPGRGERPQVTADQGPNDDAPRFTR